MAHLMVFTGNSAVYATVTHRVSANSHGSTGDVTLVQALLSIVYALASARSPLKHLLKVTGRFDADTAKLLFHFQKFFQHRIPDAIVSPAEPITDQNDAFGRWTIIHLNVQAGAALATLGAGGLLDYLRSFHALGTALDGSTIFRPAEGGASHSEEGEAAGAFGGHVGSSGESGTAM